MNRRTVRTLLITPIIALVLMSVILAVCGIAPIPVLQVIGSGAWGSATGRLLMLTKTALLILTGLAVVIPYRVGLFNIGGEGQLYLGALAAAVLGSQGWGFLGKFHLVLSIGIGTACGACWAALAGMLKTQRGIHEVISTIMLNFIAFQCVNELTFNFLSAGGGTSRTAFIQPSAQMPILLASEAAQTSWAILLSVILAGFLSLLFYRTWFGFHLRAVGSNPRASRYAGIEVKRFQVWAMMLGGGCAGLAGALETTGVNHAFYARFSGGYGFDGIAVAFLALCEPWATIPAALAIAALRASDQSLQLDLGVPKEIVLMLEGMLVIGIAIGMRKRNNE